MLSYMTYSICFDEVLLLQKNNTNVVIRWLVYIVAIRYFVHNYSRSPIMQCTSLCVHVVETFIKTSYTI